MGGEGIFFAGRHASRPRNIRANSIKSNIESPLAGLAYILLFGLGSVISMGVMTVIISLPFVVSAGRLPNINRTIQIAVGTFSIMFGGFLMYQIGFVDGLF